MQRRNERIRSRIARPLLCCVSGFAASALALGACSSNIELKPVQEMGEEPLQPEDVRQVPPDPVTDPGGDRTAGGEVVPPAALVPGTGGAGGAPQPPA